MFIFFKVQRDKNGIWSYYFFKEQVFGVQLGMEIFLGGGVRSEAKVEFISFGWLGWQGG